MENISKTPNCAMSCILDPHWAEKYAPECSQLPQGTEYGARLCKNSMYQFMIDYCIKEKCNENDRKTVRKTLEDVIDNQARELGKSTCESFGVQVDLPPW